VHSAVEDAASTDTLRDVGMDGVAHLPTFFEPQGASNYGKVYTCWDGESLTHLVLRVQVEFPVSNLDFLLVDGRAQVRDFGLGVAHVRPTLRAVGVDSEVSVAW